MNRFDGLRHWAWSIPRSQWHLASHWAVAQAMTARTARLDLQDLLDLRVLLHQPLTIYRHVLTLQRSSLVALAMATLVHTTRVYMTSTPRTTTPNTLTMTFDDLDVVAAAGGGFDLTLDLSIAKNGAPYIDPIGVSPSFESLSIYIAEYDSATGEFYNSAGGFAFGLSASNAASNGDGSYTLTQNVSVDPTAFGGGAIMGRIADGLLDTEDDNYAPSDGRRVSMYADNAAASWLIGDMATFESPANVEACQACHGTPYRKHGNSPGVVAGAPDLVYCRGCHNNTANGGHTEWQHEQDDALAWATDTPPTAEQQARYAYERTLENDVHMSHAMHLPYPQSMGTCNTCHEGKLAQVLDNSNFTWETCQGCHVVEGIDSWPDDGTGEEEPYRQAHRAPPFDYLWQTWPRPDVP